MIDALSVAASMMSDDTQRLNTISYNLANVTTTGFKRQRTIAVPFQKHLATQSVDGSFSALPVTLPGNAIQTDTHAGMLRQTSQPLDVAIEDTGFFEIKTPQGLAYTKRGDFHLNAQGNLVTYAGDPVMGVGGTIRLNTSEPVIDQNGTIFDRDQQIGQLKIMHFSNPETLVRQEGSSFIPSDKTQQDPAGYPKVRQGHLEASNVTSMEEMVRIIETMRHFESAQKIVQGYDEMMDKALTKLGQF